MDCRGMGNVRKQPQGQVLFHYEEGRQTACRGYSLLGTSYWRDGPRALDARERRRKMMDSIQEALNRVRAFFRKEPLDRDLETELAVHMDLAIEENMQRGMP